MSFSAVGCRSFEQIERNQNMTKPKLYLATIMLARAYCNALFLQGFLKRIIW